MDADHVGNLATAVGAAAAWQARTVAMTQAGNEFAAQFAPDGGNLIMKPDGKGGWTVNEWLKKALLLYFRVNEMQVVESYPAPSVRHSLTCWGLRPGGGSRVSGVSSARPMTSPAP